MRGWSVQCLSVRVENQVWNTVTSPTILLCRKGPDVLCLWKNNGMILPMHICLLPDFRSLQTSSLVASNACSRATEAVQSFCGGILQGLWIASHHRSSLQISNKHSANTYATQFTKRDSIYHHLSIYVPSPPSASSPRRALPPRFSSHDRWGQVLRVSSGLERGHGLWQGRIPCNYVRHTLQNYYGETNSPIPFPACQILMATHKLWSFAHLLAF